MGSWRHDIWRQIAVGGRDTATVLSASAVTSLLRSLHSLLLLSQLRLGSRLVTTITALTTADTVVLAVVVTVADILDTVHDASSVQWLLGNRGTPGHTEGHVQTDDG